MALVIEDGTGKTNSDSYLSEADIIAYEAKHYATTTFADADAATQELAARNGAQYIAMKYGGRWKGDKANETQAMDFPRENVVADGFELDSDEIPQALKDAQAEASRRAVGTELYADVAATGRQIEEEEKKVGPIETRTKYAGIKATDPEYRKIESLLRPLLRARNTLERS